MGNEAAMYGHQHRAATACLDGYIEKSGLIVPEDSSKQSELYINLIRLADYGFAQLTDKQLQNYRDLACALANTYYAIGRSDVYSGNVIASPYWGAIVGEKAAARAKADVLSEKFKLKRIKNKSSVPKAK